MALPTTNIFLLQIQMYYSRGERGGHVLFHSEIFMANSFCSNNKMFVLVWIFKKVEVWKMWYMITAVSTNT